MKARVKPQNSGEEVLSIRRTRKEKILLVLKKGCGVSAFEKALDQAVGQRADVNSLVSKRSLEVRDIDETVTRGRVLWPRSVSRWASQTSRTSAGCISALTARLPRPLLPQG